MNLLCGLADIGAVKRVRKIRPRRSPVGPVKSRGDEFDPNNPPPGTPEWLVFLAKQDPAKVKAIIGGALGDFYKLSVMAGLADAAGLENSAGITEGLDTSAPTRLTEGFVTGEMNGAQFKEFKRAQNFMAEVAKIGIQIKDVNGVPKDALRPGGIIYELSPEIAAKFQSTSEGFGSQVIDAYLSKGSSKAAGERYLKIKAVADRFRAMRDKALAGASKGISMLTAQGLETAKKNLEFDPKLLLSDVLSSAMGAVNGFGDSLNSLPPTAPPAPVQVAKGKLWVGEVGTDAISIAELNEAQLAEATYSIMYASINSEAMPPQSFSDIKGMVNYGSSILAKSATPILASRTITKKALNAISFGTPVIKVGGGFSVDLTPSPTERKFAKTLFMAVKKQAVSSKSPYAMKQVEKAFDKAFALMEKGANPARSLAERIYGAQTIQELDEILIDAKNAMNGGLLSQKDQDKLLAVAMNKKNNFNIRLKPSNNNKTKTVAETNNEAMQQFQRSEMARDLSGLTVDLDTQILDYINRADTYTKYGGIPPSDNAIRGTISKMNQISNKLKGDAQFSNILQQAKYKINTTNEVLRNLGNKISTTSPIGGGSGPGVTAGSGNQPVNPYNVYPSGGGPLGPPPPQTRPPGFVDPSTLAGLGSFSQQPAFVKFALALGVVYLLSRVIKKK